jgi:hypothetical protein
MDTSLYSGWDTRMQHQRKIMHFEIEEEEVASVQSLVEEAKNRKLFEKYFGPMARASNILESKRGGKKEKGRSGILYYGEILGKRTKWEEFIMLNLKFLPPF